MHNIFTFFRLHSILRQGSFLAVAENFIIRKRVLPHPAGGGETLGLCLVLSNSDDGYSTDLVAQKIREYGCEVFRFDVDKISQGQAEVEIELGKNSVATMIVQNGQTCPIEEVSSVWYRHADVFDFSIQDRGQREFAERELRVILEGLWECLADRNWLNKPWDMQRARLKVSQLRFAQQWGMRIPETKITNRPASITKFAQDYGQLIYKTASSPHIEKQEQNFNIPTSILEEQHLQHLDLISQTSGIFQNYLNKSYEVRVTAVDDQFFSAKLWNPKGQQCVVDWRLPEEFKQLHYELVEIPSREQEFCLSIMKNFHLRYATFDFVVDKNEQYTFLEMNTEGQWYWIEDLIKIPVADAIARAMARPSLS